MQYRTQKHTQKNSRDFGNATQRGIGLNNNLFRQIRQYKNQRGGSQGQFDSNRFSSNVSAMAIGQCTMQAGLQGIKDKKLASPLKI
jgi:Rod binding domain-containing protein